MTTSSQTTPERLDILYGYWLRPQKSSCVSNSGISQVAAIVRGKYQLTLPYFYIVLSIYHDGKPTNDSRMVSALVWILHEAPK